MIDQIKLLIMLARVDGSVDDKEKALIRNIASAHDIQPDAVESLLGEENNDIELESVADSDKTEYLVNMVQLMKIDGHTYNSEIAFCQDVAEKLGFDKSVILELYKLIYTNPEVRVPDSMIRDTVRQFLNR